MQIKINDKSEISETDSDIHKSQGKPVLFSVNGEESTEHPHRKILIYTPNSATENINFIWVIGPKLKVEQ
jgi:hypothetical protein